MPTSIHRRVVLAEKNQLPEAIIKLKSGWLVASQVQPTRGYCILLSNPVAKDLNSLSEIERVNYCLDMIRVGDALLKVLGADRINYETWGNLDQALHTHIVQRFLDEPDDRRVLPLCRAYDLASGRPFDRTRDVEWIQLLRLELNQNSV